MVLLNLGVMFLITLLATLLACRVFAHQIRLQRKLAASLCFAVLSQLPIPLPLPFIHILLPAVGLYVCLMDSTLERETVNRVWTMVFVLATVASLLMQRWFQVGGN